MLPEKTIFLTILISLPSFFFLLQEIRVGRVRLNLVSWVLWTVAPLIGVYFAVQAGVGWTQLPIFMAGFFPLILVLYSLSQEKYIWKIGTFDIVCGIFSVMALVVWFIFHSTNIAIFFAILSDFLAAIPSYVKSWKFPETESAFGYLPGVLNNIIAFLVIKDWTFPNYGFSLYIFLINVVFVLIIIRPKLHKYFKA